MNTTAIFVEILIIGMQASVWVSLLVISFTGWDWISDVEPKLQPWVLLITTFVFAIWYTLGIIVDRVANFFYGFYHPKNLMLKNKWANRGAEKFTSDPRVVILAQDTQGGVAAFLEYIRSRARILRSTTLNLILAIVSTLIFIFMRCDGLGCHSKSQLVIITIGVGIILVSLCIVVLATFEAGYDYRIKQAERELAKRTKGNSG